MFIDFRVRIGSNGNHLVLYVDPDKQTRVCTNNTNEYNDLICTACQILGFKTMYGRDSCIAFSGVKNTAKHNH